VVRLLAAGADPDACPGTPRHLRTLSVFLCKSVLYGVFACWARRALNRQKRRFPAPPGSDPRAAGVGAGGAADLALHRREPRQPRGGARARPRCRFAPPLVHFPPYSLTYSVPRFLKWQYDRTLGGAAAAGGRRRPGPREQRRHHPAHGGGGASITLVDALHVCPLNILECQKSNMADGDAPPRAPRQVNGRSEAVGLLLGHGAAALDATDARTGWTAGLDEGLLSCFLPRFSFLWRIPIRGTHICAE
jgi:hypothetical protein